MNYRIVVMTYKRKDFAALKLLEQDDSFTMWLAVRKEEYENGFYDHLKSNPRIQFLLLENVSDAGDTRQRIIDMCHEQGVEFVVELDDTVSSIFDPNNNSATIASCIEDTIKRMQTDKFADRIMCATLMKRSARVQYNDYGAFFIQAVVINAKKLMEESSVRFRKVKDCGFDDFTFTYELHSHGWFIIKSHACRKARSWMPHKATAGGTHADTIDIEKCCKINDERCYRTIDYLMTKYHSHPHIGIVQHCVYVKDVMYRFISLQVSFPLNKMLAVTKS